MPRTKNGGAIKRRGVWFGRASYVDPATGKQTFRERRAPTNTKSEAKRMGAVLAREIEAEAAATKPRAATFEELADFYQARYIQPPTYAHGQRVAGLRSVKCQLTHLKAIRAFFGKRLLSSITYSTIEAFRAARLATPTVAKRQRGIATVNRELALVSRMLNVAVRERMLASSPFADGEPLIQSHKETARERTITAEEERRLLEACEHPSRLRLRPVLIAALDTGMRRGELRKLRWADVDFDAGMITVAAHNTKTEQRRVIGITPRLMAELRALRCRTKDRVNGLVFGETNFEHAFVTARAAAGLEDVHFHDLRHTAATRLVNRGMGLGDVGRILGHTQPRTTYRYVNLTHDTARRAAELLGDAGEDRAPARGDRAGDGQGGEEAAPETVH